ncbi:large conductance mechanosensitive channel protein MscL [Leucobacter musarum]|uniref:large conductance mechanosensitive channel protein MscL n=1 Tax=Leucobacter musarum TaxID=1930747 RepID=UPI0006A7E540|nr:large conductance mechanosensitive channel protein MscL [Leucobacter musarum]
MFKGFRDFILRGNVIELAVAVVIGAAFNAVVQKVVDSLINPIIGAAFQADTLDGALKVGLPGPNGGEIAFGAVIGAILNFVIVAAVVYFVFVLPMNKLRPKVPEAPTGPSDVDLLGEIRDLLKAQAEGQTQAPAAAPATNADEATGGPAHKH